MLGMKCCLLKWPFAWEGEWFCDGRKVHRVTFSCKHEYIQAFLYKWDIKGARAHTLFPITSAISAWIDDTCLRKHTTSKPHQAHLPFSKPWKVLITAKTWCDVLRHLPRHPHKLETRGRATSALSSAAGSCQHILTSPGGVQLGLTSSRARGGLPDPTAAASLSLSNTHK